MPKMAEKVKPVQMFWGIAGRLNRKLPPFQCSQSLITLQKKRNNGSQVSQQPIRGKILCITESNKIRHFFCKSITISSFYQLLIGIRMNNAIATAAARKF